jgi:hypothetical protein
MDIKTTTQNPLIPIAQLKPWDKNPKNVTPEGYERLRQQLKLGQHTTLLAFEDGSVLGGNARLKLMTEMGWNTVECKVLSAKQDGEGFYALINNVVVMENGKIPQHWKTLDELKLAYSLSHNDRAGFYNDEAVLELTKEFPAFDWTKYSVDFSTSMNLDAISKQGTDKPEVSKDTDPSDDKLDTYQNGTIRQIVLYFTVEEYEKIVEQLKMITELNKLENNTEVFLLLLKEYENNHHTGDSTPTT